MLSEEDADEFASNIAGAAKRVARDYAAGDSVHEPPTTGQLTDDTAGCDSYRACKLTSFTRRHMAVV